MSNCYFVSERFLRNFYTGIFVLLPTPLPLSLECLRALGTLELALLTLLELVLLFD